MPLEEEALPAGDAAYIVEQGECLSSIAEKTGHFWQTLWNLPANAAVAEARKDPNVLLPGDRLAIPPIETKTLPAKTGRRHVFRRKGVPSFLRVRFLDAAGEPRADLAWTLKIGGQTQEGKLDADGWLLASVPPSAREATVELAGRSYVLQLGDLDPLDTTAGIRARLTSLGYPCSAAAGEPLRSVLARFQRDRELEPTGVADDATRAALSSGYGA
ncbi:MAG TPA: peptidoglycan-binding protein [Thermoanaerobaculia bacterium]